MLKRVQHDSKRASFFVIPNSFRDLVFCPLFSFSHPGKEEVRFFLLEYLS